MSGITMAPRTRARARLSAPSTIRIALLLYGVLLAGVMVQRLDGLVPDQTGLMGTRSEGVQQSIWTLESGGPPLLACGDGYDAAHPLDGCSPAGWGDDQGIYLYLPLLALTAGLDTPEEALKWFYIVLFALLALVTPLVFYGLFGSLAAAVIAGAAVVFHFDLFANTDIYWISAWCYLLCIPLLLLVYEKWNRYSRLLLCGVVAIASFATSVRIHAGLPILLGALIIAVLRRQSRLRLLATAVSACIAYLTFAAVLTAAREYRDHVVGDPSLSERYPTRHPFWHNVYIGLGYLPNRYGIEYVDAISTDFVKRTDPNADYLSPRYEQILRDEVFRITRKDPGFVTRNVLAKLGLGLEVARDRYGMVLLLTPLALFVGTTRRRWRRWLLIIAPALILSLLPSLMTMPILQYHIGWLGVWAVLWLLLACWAVTVLPTAVRSWMRRREEASGNGRPWTKAFRVMRSPALWLAVGLVGVFAIFADVVGPRAAGAVTADDLWSASADSLRAPRSGAALAQWPFDGAVAADWESIDGTVVEAAEAAVGLVTTSGRSEYQLVGPVVLLSPGRYELRADITVREGGLELGVLDTDANAWLRTAHYWHGQKGYGRQDLAVAFELPKPLRVRPIVANWRFQSGESSWLVRRIWIRRI
jgi:hypothetical protein